MDIGPTLKTNAVAAPSATSPEGKPPATELPAHKVVVASRPVLASDGSLPRAPSPLSLEDVTERRLTIDTDTRQIVLQAIDTRTQQVVGEFPDRALLGLRAYLERIADKAAASAEQARHVEGTDPNNLSA